MAEETLNIKDKMHRYITVLQPPYGFITNNSTRFRAAVAERV
jgi:hypothetical protein